jgi:hypothetical protein
MESPGVPAYPTKSQSVLVKVLVDCPVGTQWDGTG